nr:MAG TPA: hypothetical protein [Caudoviricetes sp.]
MIFESVLFIALTISFCRRFNTASFDLLNDKS